jgi:hypothetical protein
VNGYYVDDFRITCNDIEKEFKLEITKLCSVVLYIYQVCFRALQAKLMRNKKILILFIFLRLHSDPIPYISMVVFFFFFFFGGGGGWY